MPFVLVTYSTFLTRSGVLADFSVHSFTDLGINQFLVAFMLVFLGGAGPGTWLVLSAGQIDAYRHDQLHDEIQQAERELEFMANQVTQVEIDRQTQVALDASATAAACPAPRWTRLRKRSASILS